MKYPYETCVVFDGTLGDDVIAKEHHALEQFFGTNGELERVQQWGKRRLAYEVNKKKSGVYFLYQYRAEGDTPVKLERQFKLNTNVLRFLTVRRDPSLDNAPMTIEHRQERSMQSDEGDGMGDEKGVA